MPKRSQTRSDHLRSAVATEAARLMVEHGIQDFLIAKRKAAERYSVVDGAALPKNSEIEAALLVHQRLFGGPRHEDRMKEQRRVALLAMQLLEKFEPRLVGPVLSGSATEHSDIQLHVFSDNPEAVTLHLLERRFVYEVLERKLKMAVDRQIAVPSIRFDMDQETIEAVVFPLDGIRQAPISPVAGKPMRRAAMQEVMELQSSSAHQFPPTLHPL